MRGSKRAAAEKTMLPFLDQGLARILNAARFTRTESRRAGRDKICVFRSRDYWQG